MEAEVIAGGYRGDLAGAVVPSEWGLGDGKRVAGVRRDSKHHGQGCWGRSPRRTQRQKVPARSGGRVSRRVKGRGSGREVRGAQREVAEGSEQGGAGTEAILLESSAGGEGQGEE